MTDLHDALAARDDLLHSIWLYTNWRSVTRNLTIEQRELWVRAINDDRRRDEGEGYEPLGADWRWWAEISDCNCLKTTAGAFDHNSGNCIVHPLPGCPNPRCGETWRKAFHGDHCDSCGWTMTTTI